MFQNFNLVRRGVTLSTVGIISLWFAISAVPQDVKRGWAGNDSGQANAVNARWYYNWGYQPVEGIHGEFVPMFWGPYGVQKRIDAILGYDDVQYVLGFNEPERPDQADMTVEEAIEKWTMINEGLEGSGIKLVSPAVSDTIDGREWLADFMQQAEDSGLVVDEVAFHWYGLVNPANPVSSANSFLNKVDQYYSEYGRNVWVTEFAGLDFAGNYTTEEMQQANAIFFSVAVPGLESRPYVTRYSMWAHSDDSRPLVEDDCGGWKTTVVGDNYLPTLNSGDVLTLNDESVSTDIAFLRGGDVDSDSLVLDAINDLYILTNYDNSLIASSIGGANDWAMTESGTITIQQNATLRKIGENVVSVRNAFVCNDGLIRLFESGSGTLWFDGSDTEMIGMGEVRLDAGGKIRFGSLTDVTGFDVPFPFQCRGGEIEVSGNDIQFSADSTVFLQTRMDIEGSLHVSGSFKKPTNGGGSGIIKQGNGQLKLTGNNTYVGDTIVNEGSFLLNGSLAGNLVVNGGIVHGVGVVDGECRVLGTMSPGSNVGVFHADSFDFFAGSLLELELGPFGANDRLSANGPLVLNDNVTLRLVLVADYQPSIGDSFNVVDALAIVGQFDSYELPNLVEGEWDFGLFEQSGIIRVVESSVLLGDVNMDGAINLLDVGPFVGAVSNGTYIAEADVNQDGFVNLLDVDPFIELLAG